ncbi:MAG TPA: glycoside hydrolase family 3 N-terminal domain-containing protein [Longimicrobiales bacterium]
MIRRRIYPLVLALAPLTCASPSGGPPSAGIDPAASAEAWVEATMERLPLRRKVAQLVVPWLDGAYLAVGTPEHERLRGWVEEQGVGGVIVSIGPPLEIAAKLNLLQEMADVPLLVAADVESGPGQRLTAGTVVPYGMELGGGTDFPPIMALGAAGDPSLAYEVGRITAIEARAVGIHMAFAPVVDVNNNPANPIINTRSYGEDPEAVARLGAAHIRGLQDHGLLATAKHFPGHGNTSTDSHIGLPVLSVDRARADSIELVPFRAAIDAGVAAVMVAHVAFPALSGDTVPATLSRALTTGLLKEELGFDGLTVVDALDMGAITTRYGAEEAAVLALEAGADLLLMPLDVAATIDAVVAAVEAGRISEARIDRSVRKLLRLKAGLGLHARRRVELDRVPYAVGRPEHAELARRIAERAFTLVRDRDGLIPVRPTRTGRALSIVYTDDADPFAGRTFQRGLRERFAEVHTAMLTRGAHATVLDSLVAAADSADVVFVSTFVRVVSGKGRVGIPPELAAFVATIAARRPTVVTSFGNPYLLSQFPSVGTYALAWGSGAVEQEAAVRALMGEAPITGRLPITIPPDHPIGTGIRRTYTLGTARPEEVGMDAERLARVDALLEAAVRRGDIPGAALAVGRRGKLVRLRGYGRLDPRPGFAAVTDSTLYDLASLTKVVGTTTAVMLLDEAGEIELDAPVSRYLPEWGGSPDKDRVTVRHLLTHTSGLPAFAPLWRELRGKDAYVRRIAAMPLEYAPGEKTVYSDFGAILLGAIVERVSGESLDRFLEARVFGPLGMDDTGFNPLGGDAVAGKARAAEGAAKAAGPSILERIAPTEVDTIFRHTHVHGVVHDENAYAMGGVAPHAGLFSSARDLAVFAQMMLNGGVYGDVRLLDAETIARYTARQSEASSRALGWDTPSGRSSAGDYFSAASFGHTGFTGTSLWVDPTQELFVVLLTNRVNPTRANRAHIALRRNVHDAVALSITDSPVVRRGDAVMP